MFLNSIYQDVQKQQNVALKLPLKLVFFQYSTNETAYREIIYLCPKKLKYCLRDTALKDSVIYKSTL